MFTSKDASFEGENDIAILSLHFVGIVGSVAREHIDLFLGIFLPLMFLVGACSFKV